MREPLPYRPDIDGLRAVAVLAVIAFHADLKVPGGFIGVDVFFVISGYLITSILLREHAAGTYRLSDFYLRRVRRILPALFVVLAGVLLAMGWAGLASQWVGTAWTTMAGLGFVANLQLAGQAGYFAPVEEFDPLLHLWSLSVEEQVYIVLPLLITMGVRRGWTRGLLVLTCVGSFAWAVGHEHQPGAFYSTFSRFWEVGIGGLLATAAGLRLQTGTVGFVLLLGSLATIEPGVAWPGRLTLLPVLGTAMMLVDPTSWANRLLSGRPLVAIGKISYSLYLWHWPCLTIARLTSASTELSSGATASAIGTAFVLAVISTRVIERPFRSRSVSDRQVLIGTSLAALLLLSVATLVVQRSGWADEASPTEQAFRRAHHDTSPYFVDCPRADSPTADGCRFGEAAPTLLVWGDSHGPALVPAVETEQSGILAWHDSCAPLLGIDIVDHPDARSCTRFRQRTIDWLEAHPEIDTVLLVARWLPARGTLSETGGTAHIRLRDTETVDLSESENLAVLHRGLVRTLERLRQPGREVHVVGGLPEFGIDAPTVAALAARHRTPLNTTTPTNEVRAAYAPIVQVVERSGAAWVGLYDGVCDEVCQLVEDGRPLYFDHNHLTVDAARNRVSPFLRTRL